MNDEVFHVKYTIPYESIKIMIELRAASYRYLFIPIVNLSSHPQTTRYIHCPEKL